ncbi:MAG: hypothetical protein P8X98_05815 [Woeseiaceae bacterium]
MSSFDQPERRCELIPVGDPPLGDGWWPCNRLSWKRSRILRPTFKSIMIRASLLLILLGQTLFAQAQEPAPADEETIFSPEQIVADFDSMYEGLQSANFDLYAFTPRSEFDDRYREIRRSFVRPMTRFEVEMGFQPFVALAHQSHTRIESDYSGYIAYRAAGGAGFPLAVAAGSERLTVTENFSGTSEIRPGDRIVAINGTEVADLLPRMTAHISAETSEFAYVLLERYLPLVIWVELGPAEAYSVSVDHAGGGSGTYEISATSAGERVGNGMTEIRTRRSRWRAVMRGC